MTKIIVRKIFFASVALFIFCAITLSGIAPQKTQPVYAAEAVAASITNIKAANELIEVDPSRAVGTNFAEYAIIATLSVMGLVVIMAKKPQITV